MGGLVSGLDWRVKYYGVQAATFLMSTFIVGVGLLPGLFSDSFKWTVWLALPLAMAIGGVGWLVAGRFSPHKARHLSPREWEELRGALEDVPVISVFHVFLADRSRMERFRYVPLLQRYLWECLGEDKVDCGRVARAAFVLHNFGVDMSEYQEGLPLIPDPVLRAWMEDLAAEPGSLKVREHLREHTGEISGLINALAEPANEEGDPAMEAAWRLMLFDELAHQNLRAGLDHRDPKVREACLGLLEVRRVWPERHDDLVRRIQRDVNPSVQQAAMELLALAGKAALPVLNEVMADPFLAAKAEELIAEIEAA